MSYQRINKLEVLRKLSDGARVVVGLLAQNQQGIYFQYDTDYLAKFHNLSPFNLAMGGGCY